MVHIVGIAAGLLVTLVDCHDSRYHTGIAVVDSSKIVVEAVVVANAVVGDNQLRTESH